MASDMVAKVSVMLENGQYKEAIQEIAKGTKGMGQQTEQSAGLMAKAFAKVQIALGLLKSGLQKLFALAKESVQAFINQVKASVNLQTALRNTGQDVSRLSKEYRAFASQLQKTAGQDDDLTVNLIAQATSMGVVESKMKPLIQAVTDMSAAGYNSETAMRGLANILQGNVEVLARYLPELRQMKADGKSVDEIFKHVTSRFAGNAEAMNKATNSIETLRQTVGDAKEDFGQGYLQGIKPFMEGIQEMLDKRNGIQNFGKFAGLAISIIAQAAITATSAISALIKMVRYGASIEQAANKKTVKDANRKLNANIFEIEKQQAAFEDVQIKFPAKNKEEFNKRYQKFRDTVAPLEKENEELLKTINEAFPKSIPDYAKNVASDLEKLLELIQELGKEADTSDVKIDKLLGNAPSTTPTGPIKTAKPVGKDRRSGGFNDVQALAAAVKIAQPNFEAIAGTLTESLDLVLQLSQALGIEASASAGQFAGVLQSIGSKIPGIAGAIVQAVGMVFELTSGLIRALEPSVDMTTEFTKQREAVEDLSLRLNAINEQVRTMKSIVDTINLATSLGVSGFGEAREAIEGVVEKLRQAQQGIGKQFGLEVGADGLIKDLDQVQGLIDEKTDREATIIDRLGDLQAIQARIKKNIFKGEFLSAEDQAAVKSVVDDLVRLEAISQDTANKIVAESAGSFMGVSSDVREWINRAISETEKALKDLGTEINGLNSAVGNNQELLQRLEELRLFQISNLSEELKLLESDAQVLAAQGKDNNDNMAGQLDLIDEIIAQYEALNDAGQYQTEINDLLVKQANLRKQAEQATADAMKRQLDIVRQLQDTGLFDEQNINDVRKLQSYLQSSGMSAADQMQAYQDLNVQQAPAGLRQQYLTQYITVNEAEQENLEQRAFNSLVRAFLGK